MCKNKSAGAGCYELIQQALLRRLVTYTNPVKQPAKQLVQLVHFARQ